MQHKPHMDSLVVSLSPATQKGSKGQTGKTKAEIRSGTEGCTYTQATRRQTVLAGPSVMAACVATASSMCAV